MDLGRTRGAVLAQAMGQALATWALLAHGTRWPDVSIWVIAFLLAAAVVPARHDGSHRDRAAGNFGAALALAGTLWWDVLADGLDSILGGGGFGLGAETLLMLTATVLFTVAGGLFWTAPDETAES